MLTMSSAASDGPLEAREELAADVERFVQQNLPEFSQIPRIGEILVRQGAISQPELERVLLEQQASDAQSPKLGDLLVDKGLVSASQLEDAISRQHLRFGEILVEKGVLSQPQLDRALAQQQRDGTKLGETLLRMGWISPQDLVNNLAELYWRKAGYWLLE